MPPWPSEHRLTASHRSPSDRCPQLKVQLQHSLFLSLCYSLALCHTLAFRHATTPSTIDPSPAENPSASTIDFCSTASTMLIAVVTMPSTACFFCSPDFAPNIASTL